VRRLFAFFEVNVLIAIFHQLASELYKIDHSSFSDSRIINAPAKR